MPDLSHTLSIRASGVTKTYFPKGTTENGLTVLHGVNLEINRGSFVALIGPSGSGKTTLLSLLAGLDSLTSGEIEIEGQRIDRLSEEELARFRGENLGFVFQSCYLLPHLSALENVAVPLRLGKKNLKRTEIMARAVEALQKVGLDSRIHHYPNQLSGGEQQRVAVARALVSSPKILFADEPTGNLDSVNGEKILEIFLSFKGKLTLVLITHDRELAARMDRQLSMRDGYLITPATPNPTPNSLAGQQ